MGFDIYGLKPKQATPRPSMENWATITEEERQAIRNANDEWEQSTDGAYFRANIWGWTPLRFLSHVVNEEKQLKIKMDDWGYNDGGGCRSGKKCVALANGIEQIVNGWFENYPELTNDSRMYFYSGGWKELVEGSNGAYEELPESIINQLNDMAHIYEFNPIPFELDGKKYVSSSSTSPGYVKGYIHFLRNCGGMKIW